MPDVRADVAVGLQRHLRHPVKITAGTHGPIRDDAPGHPCCDVQRPWLIQTLHAGNVDWRDARSTTQQVHPETVGEAQTT